MIETHELTKHFKDVQAVDGIDLTVARGELVALLGPNGAGKSTTLRMLTTLIPPTSGTATGRRLRRGPRSSARCGSGSATSARATAPGTASAAATSWSARGGRTADRARRPAAGRRADRLARPGRGRRPQGVDLSGGQRRRLDIAMGLIHAPELLFLDEPSTGLDPQNRANLQEHILRLREPSTARRSC
jgi:ABC-2 type transport system ATP-binding protein